MMIVEDRVWYFAEWARVFMPASAPRAVRGMNEISHAEICLCGSSLFVRATYGHAHTCIRFALSNFRVTKDEQKTTEFVATYKKADDAEVIVGPLRAPIFVPKLLFAAEPPKKRSLRQHSRSESNRSSTHVSSHPCDLPSGPGIRIQHGFDQRT
jgi:hypothetical protein